MSLVGCLINLLVPSLTDCLTFKLFNNFISTVGVNSVELDAKMIKNVE